MKPTKALMLMASMAACLALPGAARAQTPTPWISIPLNTCAPDPGTVAAGYSTNSGGGGQFVTFASGSTANYLAFRCPVTPVGAEELTSTTCGAPQIQVELSQGSSGSPYAYVEALLYLNDNNPLYYGGVYSTSAYTTWATATLSSSLDLTPANAYYIEVLIYRSSTTLFPKVYNVRLLAPATGC